MKKLFKLYCFFPILVFIASSCYKAPEFPVVPEISFKSIEFYDVPTSDNPRERIADSLVVTINFQDGDGDLGVNGDENDFPYHSLYFFTTDKKKIPSPGNTTLLKYNSSDTSLPPFNKDDYRIGGIKDGQLITNSNSIEFEKVFPKDKYPELPDTFYVEENIFAYNFLVDFLVKKDDSFVEFDFSEATASGNADRFDSRFPIIFDTNTPGKPLSGQLTNRMISLGFIPNFRNEIVKLRIQIIDRALNMSNIIETPAFYFEKIEGTELYELKFAEE